MKDLSTGRHRQVEQEEGLYEKPAITLERTRQLDAVATSDVGELERMLAKS